MTTINKGYVDEEGKCFTNIRDIHFKNNKELVDTLGTPLFKPVILKSTEGYYIYQSPFDQNKAFRIDRKFYNKYFKYLEDYEFVSQLLEYQKDISLTEFPTGIITLEDRVIGQEIPLYHNSQTLYDLTETKFLQSKEIRYKIYLDVIKIICELLNNGIIYQDIHGDNFLYDIETKEVRLIDFEPHLVTFGYDLEAFRAMLVSLKAMIFDINHLCDDSLENSFNNIWDLNTLEKVISDKYHSIINPKCKKRIKRKNLDINEHMC